MNLALFLKSFVVIAKGIPVTLALIIISSVIGVVIAVSINALRKHKIISGFLSVYVFFFRGTPLFLQLFLVYYGLGQVVQYIPGFNHGFWFVIFKDAFIYPLIALTLNTGAYGSYIIKGALDAVPKGQIEAAEALGFPKLLIVTRVIIPQAFFYALPAYSNEIVILVKASSLASLVTVMDITGYLTNLRAETYAFYEPFLVAAIYYLAINYIIIVLFRCLEKKSKKWLAVKESSI